jgi:hypothetical protein
VPGVRNLRLHGTLGLTFLSRQQMKARPPRQERSPRTIPWVVSEQVAHAVSVLEDLATGQMLFPLGRSYGGPGT